MVAWNDMPTAVLQALEDTSGLVKKEVPVATLRALAEHCARAMAPYHKHPKLMSILLKLLHTGDHK